MIPRGVWAWLALVTATASADNGVQLAPFSIIRGQAVQLNVYHEAAMACRLLVFFSYGENQRFRDEQGEPWQREIWFRTNDRSRARRFTLPSDIAFAEFAQPRLRLQVHVQRVDNPEFSPPAPSTCQTLRVSAEVWDEATQRTVFVLWDILRDKKKKDGL